MELARHSVLLATVIGGATSGVFSRLLFHPIDTCKATMQCASFTSKGVPVPVPHTVWKTMVQIARSQGIMKGLYAGFGISALGAIPGCCAYFTAYEFIKHNVLKQHDGHASIDFSCGFLAEMVSCIVWVPVDVCKERLQTQRVLHVTNYKSSWDAMRRIAFNEGLGQVALQITSRY